MRWRLFGTGLALLAGLGLLGVGLDRLPGLVDPLTRGGAPDDACVGQTLGGILQRFGPPSGRWAGHYASPAGGGARDRRPVFSLAYQRPSGTLYLAFHLVDDDWVCFNSTWLPGGEDFSQDEDAAQGVAGKMAGGS
jgi:hypothetical protein